MPTISLIAAVAEDMAIGKNKELLCHMPNDLKRFKDLTVNHAVIMGRRTFESLPDGALPNRKNLVLTSIPESFYDNAFACSSIEDALNLCESQDEVFIIGGAMIYKQTIEMADKLYITEIHHKLERGFSGRSSGRRKTFLSLFLCYLRKEIIQKQPGNISLYFK